MIKKLDCDIKSSNKILYYSNVKVEGEINGEPLNHGNIQKTLGLTSEASIILNGIKSSKIYISDFKNENNGFNGNLQLNDGIDCSSGVQQLSFFEKGFVFRVDHFLLEFQTKFKQ
ncbi:hypothetical protein ACTFIW_012640 [Dictyostelium discoideum]